ncbi:MAG: M20/M25/M40 family metallo-hydrolase [Candidatus Humimicrobiaceae bacterium]
MDNNAILIRKNISAKRMASHIKELVKYGPRHSGTDREHKAADYVKKVFNVQGVKVKTDKVDGIINWKLKDCRVRVVKPVEQELTSIALLGSGSTPKEGIIAELLYIGKGTMGDYLKADFKDRFIMRDPPRSFMLDNASDESAPQGPTKMLVDGGVAGFIEHARFPGRILQMPLLSGPDGIAVPAVAVTYEDGQYLKELLREWYAVPGGCKRISDKIDVEIKIQVDASCKPGYGINVIGRIDGADKPDEVICLVSHHDNANGPGANDNAAAVAVNLEVANVLNKFNRPKRSIEFLSVTAEEFGEVGSDSYVNKYVKKDPSKYKGVINMDMINLGDHLYYIERSICLGKLVENDKKLNAKIKGMCDQLGYHIEGTPLEYASDDGPFILAGIPTSYVFSLTPRFSWLHTYMDDFDVININGLTSTAEIMANSIWQLANE